MKPTPKQFLTGVCAVTLIAAAAACTDGDEVTSSAGSGSGTVTEITSVGLMLQDISNPFFAAMQDGMKAEAEAQGIELNVQDGRQDLGTQNEQIDTFIQQGVQLILLNAVDSEGIGSAVQRAKAAGIIVVAVDVDASGADAAVTTDNVMAGTLACEALVEKMGESGNILFIEGTPTTAPQERVQGCEQVIAKYPDISIVARQAGKNDRASGLQLATDMLTANSDVQGIFAINDPEALGADLAVQQAGRTGITIVGVDGAPEAVEALKDPASSLWATPAQDPAGMVKKAFEVGKEIAAGNPPTDRITLLEPTTVTRDTVNEYAGW